MITKKLDGDLRKHQKYGTICITSWRDFRLKIISQKYLQYKQTNERTKGN